MLIIERKLRLPSWRYEEIKRIVVNMFEKYNVNIIPIDVFELAKKMNIEIIPYSKFSEEVVKLFLKESEDGFFVIGKNTNYRIFYNDNGKNVPERIKYTIAHEIGHIVLGHLEKSELAEQEANFFAKYALAPPVLVDQFCVDEANEIAIEFKISNQAAEIAFEYYKTWKYKGLNQFTDYEWKMLELFNMLEFKE